MSGRRTSFGKSERERAKKAKAAAKREVRHTRSAGADAEPEDEPQVVGNGAPAQDETSTADLLAQVEALHQRFDAGVLAYEQFEEQKAELLGRLRLE